jgi:hypothetical protein
MAHVRSAVMLVTDPGTPHEMVTMPRRDGEALLATHDCAAMNQPRMTALTAPLPSPGLVARPGQMRASPRDESTTSSPTRNGTCPW